MKPDAIGRLIRVNYSPIHIPMEVDILIFMRIQLQIKDPTSCLAFKTPLTAPNRPKSSYYAKNSNVSLLFHVNTFFDTRFNGKSDYEIDKTKRQYLYISESIMDPILLPFVGGSYTTLLDKTSKTK